MIEARADVEFVDKGLEELFARVRDASRTALDIGTIGAPKDVAKRAAIHEFGAPEANIPQRSFLRSTLLEGRDRYGARIKALLTSWQAGEITLDAALFRLSILVVGDVQKKIIRGIEPALKPATVARKRRLGLPRPNVALAATMQLYNAVKARIV